MSEMIIVKFPDGNSREFAKGSSPLEIAKGISGKLAKESICAEYSGKKIDMSLPLQEDGEIKFFTFNDDEGKEVFWHSTAHIMAEAVKALFPETKVTIGPAIESGFYYDFDRDTPFTPDDLEKIEKKMTEIIKKDMQFTCEILPKSEAYERFKNLEEPYKLELLDDIEDETVSLYTQSDFTDLCRGPHIPTTKIIKAFKLLNVAGAYWRGLETNKMLQRIYGISFPKKKLLDEYLVYLEEAKKRDHRKLGADLDLFMTDENIGPGLILWKPRGAAIRRVIENTLYDEHEKRGYQIVYTPHIARYKLWEVSGHANFYTSNMFNTMEVEGGEYQIRPMNCPFHMIMYRSDLKSYRDLPLRMSELGTDYRYERSGVLHGLMRVRGFTMDDAHIFCTESQMTSEIENVMNFAFDIFKMFGFKDLEIYLSTRPDKFVGEPRIWDIAEKALQDALDDLGVEYTIDPGEGAFYGPKIDVKVRDAIGRTWQCSTIQVDLNLPERFDLTYIDEKGDKVRPIMIHRAVLGSLERFFGILIEHYSGNFPLWLSPTQVKVLPISEKYDDYAKEVLAELKAKGIRAEIDNRNEKIGYRIREAEHMKTNYMLIVGDKEKETRTVSVRKHIDGDLGTMNLDEAIEKFLDEIQRRC